MMKSEIVDFLEKLEKQLSELNYSIPADGELSEQLDNIIFSVACHADIINAETIEND